MSGVQYVIRLRVADGVSGRSRRDAKTAILKALSVASTALHDARLPTIEVEVAEVVE